MEDKIRVLNINYDSSEYGGVSVFLMNIFRNIDYNKFQIDFLTPDTTSFNPWREEIESLGGNLFEFHINRRRQIRFGRRLRSFLAKYPYDIVHVNSGSVSFDCISAVAAKSQGAKVIIHSHNSNVRSWWKNLLSIFQKPRMQKKADVLCACSEEAARNVFTKKAVDQKKVIIINNGIDLKKFCYNPEIRKKIRQELNLENKFVVGHVGRFEEQKNHEFLIDIFSKILQEEPTAILLLIGQGKLEHNIKEKVCNLNLENNVIFLGRRDDVENWYQAMDVFLFPSFFEGFPISLVEAQSCGLPCCISDTISPEVDLTPLVKRVSLRDSLSQWAQKVFLVASTLESRHSFDQELEDMGFGIKAATEQIVHLYDDLMHT